MNRFETMQRLLDTRKFFKLVCGAGNEDAQEVKRLVILFAFSNMLMLKIDLLSCGNRLIDNSISVSSPNR